MKDPQRGGHCWLPDHHPLWLLESLQYVVTRQHGTVRRESPSPDGDLGSPITFPVTDLTLARMQYIPLPVFPPVEIS